MAMTTRPTPAAISASAHGGVRPWCEHGSSVTCTVAPRTSTPRAAASRNAMISACGAAGLLRVAAAERSCRRRDDDAADARIRIREADRARRRAPAPRASAPARRPESVCSHRADSLVAGAARAAVCADTGIVAAHDEEIAPEQGERRPPRRRPQTRCSHRSRPRTRPGRGRRRRCATSARLRRSRPRCACGEAEASGTAEARSESAATSAPGRHAERRPIVDACERPIEPTRLVAAPWGRETRGRPVGVPPGHRLRCRGSAG